MKIGAGGPQIQTAQEFKLGIQKTEEPAKIEEHPEQIGSKDNEGKNLTASLDKVVKTVEELNKFSALINTHLRFQIHDKTKKLMVQVTNEEGEVIREIPPEWALEMLAKLRDSTGAIIDCYI